MIVILGGGLSQSSRRRILSGIDHVSSKPKHIAGRLSAARGPIATASFSTTPGISSTCATSGRSELWTSCGRARSRSSRATPSIRTRGVTFRLPVSGEPPRACRRTSSRTASSAQPTRSPTGPGRPRRSLREWSSRGSGRGISEAFMFAVQREAVPPRVAGDDRLIGFVGVPARISPRSSAVRWGSRTSGMGYSATFRYPIAGGIEVVPNALRRQGEDPTGQARVPRPCDLGAQSRDAGDGRRSTYDRLGLDDPASAPSDDRARRAAFDGAGRGASTGRSSAAWISASPAARRRRGRTGSYFPDADVALLPRGVPARDERRRLSARSLVALRRVRAPTRRASGSGALETAAAIAALVERRRSCGIDDRVIARDCIRHRSRLRDLRSCAPRSHGGRSRALQARGVTTIGPLRRMDLLVHGARDARRHWRPPKPRARGA